MLNQERCNQPVPSNTVSVELSVLERETYEHRDAQLERLSVVEIHGSSPICWLRGIVTVMNAVFCSTQHHAVQTIAHIPFREFPNTVLSNNTTIYLTAITSRSDQRLL